MKSIRKIVSTILLMFTISPLSAQINDEIIINAALSFVDEGKTVKFPVKGKSMTPFIKNEECVLLEKCKQYNVGDIVLAHLPEKKFVIHRIFSLEDGAITLMGDGNLFGKEYCHVDSLKAICRYKFDKEGNKLSLCSDSQKARAELWRNCLSQREKLLSTYSQDTESKFWEDLFRICITSEDKLKMTIRQVYDTKKIGKETILISKELENIDFSSLPVLNESAEFLFSSMKGKLFNLSEIVDILMKEFDVDKQTATMDCVNMLTTWFTLGVIKIGT